MKEQNSGCQRLEEGGNGELLINRYKDLVKQEE